MTENPCGTAYSTAGDGPPVVLVHGLGLNRAMWQWQRPALERNFRVSTYDLLGHGESAPPAGTPDLAMFSEQLRDVLDRCEIERAAVVGFSLGGMIVRRFALDHPDRLWGLAVLNSAHDRTPAEREAILKRVRQARGAGPASTVDAALVRWFSDDFRAANPALMALIRDWVTANDPLVYPEIYRVLAQGDAEIAEPIAGIECPTLVMTGEEDFGNSPEMARNMAAMIPGAELKILPGLRHMGLAESPSKVNEPLTAFLLAACHDRSVARTGG